MIGNIYFAAIYQPLLNALIFFYNTVAFRDLGTAIIIITVLIRLILAPLFKKSAEHQAAMQRIQPKLKKIQETHKHDKEKQTQAMMDLYKEHRINPFAGILLLVVQIPILIGLYRIMFDVLSPDKVAHGLYGFVAAPGAIAPTFLGLINLHNRSIVMVALAALAQYLQGWLTVRGMRQEGGEESDAERMGRRMVLISPLITLLIFYNLPAAVSLYWCVTSLVSAAQQVWINKHLRAVRGAEAAE